MTIAILSIVIFLAIIFWPARSKASRQRFQKAQAQQQAQVLGTFEHKRISGFRLLLFGPLGLLFPKKDKVVIRKP